MIVKRINQLPIITLSLLLLLCTSRAQTQPLDMPSHENLLNVRATSYTGYDVIEADNNQELEVILYQDFESGWNDWWSDFGIWDVGAPTSGPNGAYSGTQCAATVLDGMYPYGPGSILVSPPVQLPEVAFPGEILLRFRQWWSYQSADRGYVQIQTYDYVAATWSDWGTLKEVYSYDSTWHHARVDLTPYAGQWVRIGFYHQDGTEMNGPWNAHAESSGWYIDDVEIIRQAVPQFCGFEGFELGWDGWWCDHGIWEVGPPTSGPGEAYSGTQCAATVLDGMYPYGPGSILVSPPVQLPEVAFPGEILLRFRQWWSYSSFDKGQVKIRTYDESTDTWSEWAPDPLHEVKAYNTTSWHHARVPLTAYSGQRIQLGFYHEDNMEMNGPWNAHAESLGWYIDDVEISPSPLCSTTIYISSTDGGSVVVPGEGEFPCDYGEKVYLAVEAEDGYRFARWEGTAVDAGRVYPNETDPNAYVIVDGNYTLKAVFESNCMVIYDFPLDEDPGWIMTGEWEFGIPTGHDCGVYGGPDPTSGHIGSNVIGVNLDGCYDPGIGPVYDVVAGPFDFSGYRDVKLRFWRWLNTDIPEFVENRIEMSFDGSNWNPLWIQGERTEIIDAKWIPFEYPIPEADCQPMVYIRWSYEVKRERAYAYTGWNIDDIQLTGCRDDCQ